MQGIGRLVKQWQEPLPQPAALALGAAEAATDASARQAAEPLARRRAALRAAAALRAGLAREADVLADRPGATHGLHGPPPQPTQPPTDTERDARAREQEARSERSGGPRNLKNCRRDDRFARQCAARRVRSISAPGSGSERSGGQAHGWSPECSRGVHGIGRFVKQWHDGLLHSRRPQLHSEQRKRQPTRPLVRQQNHSPPVLQPSGQPPPCWQLLHVYFRGPARRVTAGEKQGLHGPPPQPTQPETAPSETPVRVSKSPAPSEPAPRNLKNWRREERARARERARCR